MLNWTDQLLWIAGGTAAAMLVLWLIQIRTRDAGVVDVGWAGCLGASAAFIALTGDGDPVRRMIIGVMGGVWGVRLALHLLFDRVLNGPEDGRYQMMRETLGPRTNAVFLAFFQAQALLVVLLSAPFVLAARADAPSPSPTDVLGVVIWFVAIIGETIADQQLKAFKRRPDSHAKVCDTGMWRYSRHPNYFFEWLIWIAFSLVAAAGPLGWIAWSAPAMMLFFILAVTGIPPTEKRALRSRPQAYRRYQETTWSFVPWFPKRAGSARDAQEHA